MDCGQVLVFYGERHQLKKPPIKTSQTKDADHSILEYYKQCKKQLVNSQISLEAVEQELASIQQYKLKCPQVSKTQVKAKSSKRKYNNLHEVEGLKYCSYRVAQKLINKKSATHSEIAQELIAEMGINNKQKYQQKNVRRRVYDALNVMQAAQVVNRDNQCLVWRGISPDVGEVTQVQNRIRNLKNKISTLKRIIFVIEQQLQRSTPASSTNNLQTNANASANHLTAMHSVPEQIQCHTPTFVCSSSDTVEAESHADCEREICSHIQNQQAAMKFSQCLIGQGTTQHSQVNANQRSENVFTINDNCSALPSSSHIENLFEDEEHHSADSSQLQYYTSTGTHSVQSSFQPGSVVLQNQVQLQNIQCFPPPQQRDFAYRCGAPTALVKSVIPLSSL